MDTRLGDLLLIHHQGQPVSYARVEDITADVKSGWWQLSLLLLQVPVQRATWILREEYIDGGEFTMGGETMRLERLAPPAGLNPPQEEPPPSEPAPLPGGEGKVLSLKDRRRK